MSINDIEKNNSGYLKASLLNYFRFKRQMYVATELNCNYGISDIVATDRKRVYEVKIKCCLSDFYADFKNKSAKHQYMNDNKFIYRTKPNYFLFGFHYDFFIENKEKIFEKIHKNYGIIIIHNIYSCYIEKKAKLLHNEIKENIFYTIVKRNASEIANLYTEKYS